MRNACKRVRGWVYGFGTLVSVFPAVASAQLNVGQVRADSNLSTATVVTLVTNLMGWGLYLIGFLGVIAFVISGIYYLTSAGDDDKIDKAKNTMIYGIIGVLVALIGLIVVNAVNTFLGGTNKTF